MHLDQTRWYRLSLTPPASIRLDGDCTGISVSEAEWPKSSGKDFEARCTHCYACPPALDSADDGFLPAPPYEDPVEVKPIDLLPNARCAYQALAISVKHKQVLLCELQQDIAT